VARVHEERVAVGAEPLAIKVHAEEERAVRERVPVRRTVGVYHPSGLHRRLGGAAPLRDAHPEQIADVAGAGLLVGHVVPTLSTVGAIRVVDEDAHRARVANPGDPADAQAVMHRIGR
jgi:hypothetical protein